MGDGNVNAAHINSGSATNRQALLADGSQGATFDDIAAEDVDVDATNFSDNLSGTDTDVQTALETLDALTVSGVPFQGTWQAGTYSAGQIVVRSGIDYLSLVNNNTETPSPAAQNWTGFLQGFQYRGDAPVTATNYNYGQVVFNPDTDTYYFFTSTVSASVARADIPTHANFHELSHFLTNAEVLDATSDIHGTVSGELLAASIQALSGGGKGYGDWASIGSVTGAITSGPVTVALDTGETIDDYEELYIHIESNNADDQRSISPRFRASDVPETALVLGGLLVGFPGFNTDEGAIFVRRNADGDSLVLDPHGSNINFPATAVTTIHARALSVARGNGGFERTDLYTETARTANVANDTFLRLPLERAPNADSKIEIDIIGVSSGITGEFPAAEFEADHWLFNEIIPSTQTNTDHMIDETMGRPASSPGNISKSYTSMYIGRGNAAGTEIVLVCPEWDAFGLMQIAVREIRPAGGPDASGRPDLFSAHMAVAPSARSAQHHAGEQAERRRCRHHHEPGRLLRRGPAPLAERDTGWEQRHIPDRVRRACRGRCRRDHRAGAGSGRHHHRARRNVDLTDLTARTSMYWRGPDDTDEIYVAGTHTVDLLADDQVEVRFSVGGPETQAWLIGGGESEISIVKLGGAGTGMAGQQSPGANAPNGLAREHLYRAVSSSVGIGSVADPTNIWNTTTEEFETDFSPWSRDVPTLTALRCSPSRTATRCWMRTTSGRTAHGRSISASPSSTASPLRTTAPIRSIRLSIIYGSCGPCYRPAGASGSLSRMVRTAGSPSCPITEPQSQTQIATTRFPLLITTRNTCGRLSSSLRHTGRSPITP